MTFDWFLSLLLFIFVAGFTPGPNNIIAMSTGFNYGFRSVLPHVAGTTIGFPVMLLLIGFVLRPIMDQFELFFMLLKYASVLYILYIAYHIATAPTDGIDIDTKKKPITFLQSVAFQWINPKAWAGALATVTIYMPPNDYANGLIVAAITSGTITLLALSSWALMGREINKFFSNSRQIMIFNVTMALLLIVSVMMMLF